MGLAERDWILLWGPRQHGKSTFFGMMCHSAPSNKYVVKPIDDNDPEREASKYRTSCVANALKTAGTPTDPGRDWKKLILTYDLLREEDNGVEAKLKIVDPSGEYFQTFADASGASVVPGDLVNSMAEALSSTACLGIVVVINPLHCDNDSFISYEKELEVLLNLLGAMKGQGTCCAFVAFAFTWAEHPQVYQRIVGHKRESWLSEHCDLVEKNEMRSLEKNDNYKEYVKNMRKFAVNELGDSLVGIIEGYCGKRYRFFAASAFGFKFVDGEISDVGLDIKMTRRPASCQLKPERHGEIQPLVWEPVRWILSNSHFIDPNWKRWGRKIFYKPLLVAFLGIARLIRKWTQKHGS